MKQSKLNKEAPKPAFLNFDHKSIGAQTRELLKNKKIKSPSVYDKIEVKPGLWVVPKEKLTTQEEKDQFKENFIKKLSIPAVPPKGGLTKVFKLNG